MKGQRALYGERELRLYQCRNLTISRNSPTTQKKAEHAKTVLADTTTGRVGCPPLELLGDVCMRWLVLFSVFCFLVFILRKSKGTSLHSTQYCPKLQARCTADQLYLYSPPQGGSHFSHQYFDKRMNGLFSFIYSTCIHWVPVVLGARYTKANRLLALEELVS